ncbi:MAG: glycoside hydrolase family 3 C-terminal domain-containing protein [Bacteroidota bacterium]
MKPVISILFFISIFSIAGAQNFPLYKDKAVPVEQRVADLLQKMTIEEKIDMLGGYEGFYIRPNTRLGIPVVKMADGPLGVRNYGKATAFPGGICFASTWNTGLVKKYGEAVGTEARSKGVHIMLAPGVNIYRAPMGGRNFEYYGEDPFLASRMAVSYIEGVQSQGVVATIKHFAANNQEFDRYNVSSDVDERTLREIYLPAFRAAVEEAHVGAVMNSYNLLNGAWTSQNEHLLKDILKTDWKFDGILMSDWGSTHDGVAAAIAGLDLEMPAGDFMNRKNLLPALQDGRLKQSDIDDKVSRMLRIMFRFGFFDRVQADTTLPLYNPGSRLVALQAAREGIVLLKNENNMLPLDRSKVKSIAVIGPDAHPAVAGGGGSSIITPYRSISFLDGITNIAGEEVSVFYSPGVNTDLDEMTGTSVFSSLDEKGGKLKGLKGEYFANMFMTGEPVMNRRDEHISFNWQNGSPAPVMPADSFSIRWTGSISIPVDGNYYFYVSGNNGFRLYLDDMPVIDEWGNPSFKAGDKTMTLLKGEMKVKLEYYEKTGEAQVAFGWRQIKPAGESEAIRLAAKCDVAVVSVGFNADTEGEGFDRPFELPAEQADLIKNIGKVNKRTIVVLTSGGNVASSDWISLIPAYLAAWYPGQEGGTALAEILFGFTNPSGKLPVSFEKRWEDNATFNSYYDADKDNHVKYTEGIFVGYRHFDKNNIEPLFPFGYGLSYTGFEFNDLAVKKVVKGPELPVKVEVSFNVTNTGKKEGAEVAQVYIHQIKSGVIRPVKELKGFSKVFLKPGETNRVNIILTHDAFEYYDVEKKSWVIEPGDFEFLVGSSSRDIRLKKTFRVE